MRYEVWIEGAATNGDRSKARLFGVAEADSFSKAVVSLYAGLAGEPYRKLGYRIRIGGDGFMQLFGCRFFDNELDARAAFG